LEVKSLTNRENYLDIKGYQDEFLKMGGVLFLFLIFTIFFVNAFQNLIIIDDLAL
jgi:hypothetical protein